MTGKKIILIAIVLAICFSPAHRILALAQSEEEVRSEIDAIDRRLEEATAQYDGLVREIESVDREIADIDRERELLNDQLGELSNSINKRLAGVYKYGDVSLIEVIAGSRTIEDLTDRLALLRRITIQDFQLLESVRAKQELLDRKADELRHKRQERNQLLLDLESRRMSIQTDLNERQGTLETLQAKSASSDSSSNQAPVPAAHPNLTRSEEGIATWYEFTGGMTAAHNTLPLGTMVRVTSLKDGRSVWVEIVDRGIQGSAIIDLERVAFAQIADPYFDGVCPVLVEW